MLNVDAVTAAILGLSVLLITGVVTWKECLGEAVAWDTLTWFAALIAMAGYLNKYGLISWFSQTVVKVCSFISYCFHRKSSNHHICRKPHLYIMALFEGDVGVPHLLDLKLFSSIYVGISV